ncbi:hypothetical protein L6164_023017 [Bauhinia variegata]|uniref:Uncharacterized protein n=1 Tax=Bauhinia variegata TaxID=167791 RepID=A0ACB9MHE1_BAUVA|nr:hypothetical protein L6164_023017 [Bauhinia variegata]
MNHLTVHTEDPFSSLLELASNNDVEGFKQVLDRDASSINEVGLWYERQNGSKKVVLEHRTPLMVAATYGSISVLKLILSFPEVDVNLSCGTDKSTALHCAASGGSLNAVDAVNLLLSAGADLNSRDANGNRPFDVIVGPPKQPGMQTTLEELLSYNSSEGSVSDSIAISVNSSSPDSAAQLSSSENGLPYSPSGSPSSLAASKFTDMPHICN